MIALVLRRARAAIEPASDMHPGDDDNPGYGIWNIPVPAGGVATLPDIVVAPAVCYYEAGFRHGYGGGFYDRVLAAMPSSPLTFGVGYALARCGPFIRNGHDIPLDRMVIDEE